jgi:hypothetical protein
MTVESATFIGSLNKTLPLDTDPKSEGDDHLRLIKAVLQATFPNLNGPVTVTPDQLNSTGYAGTPNGFIDGAFDFWQPLTGTMNGAFVSAVMWRAYAGAGGVGTFAQQDLKSAAVGYQFDSNPYSAAIFTITTASTGSVAARTHPQMWQAIEGANRYSGKSVTVQFKLWCGAGTVNIPNIVCIQNFGSGGSPSSVVIFDKAVNWTVTTTPKRFSVRVDVPSVAGKVFGTNGVSSSFIAFGLGFPVGSTYAVGIAEAQVKPCSPLSSGDLTGVGGEITPFEYQGIGPEGYRMNRYWQ